ncbi:putative deacetylase LmbE-like domain-containing protein [Collybia nuda]|uniref:N-acetylglucosaminylphosphatidylinositol deacetylase n=1 Tax=Collybia nuda TaxID=64659 RepID=A0A9P5Y640_9AGAR|nr:putative deacetylase LmbE-like domain-containing protein [Collybia nuda]
MGQLGRKQVSIASPMLRLSFYVVLLCFVFAILRLPEESDNLNARSIISNGNTGRILLLTAHPDDECMFFAPTITALAGIPRTLDAGNHRKDAAAIYSLCLSIGDADRLGYIRRRELDLSLDVLGILKSNSWVLDHPDLKDNMSSHWSPAIIANTITPYIIEHQISTILTFDEKGVSNHPNHKSLREGVIHFLRYYDHPTLPPPRLFTLITVPLTTKYTSIIAALLAKFDLYKHRLFHHIRLLLRHDLTSYFPHNPNASQEFTPVFISGIFEYSLAIRAMRKHASQLVWFRYLYVIFSRYMWVNEWAEVKISL